MSDEPMDGLIPMDDWNQCIPDWQHPVESSVSAWADGWSGPEVRALMRGQLAAIGGGGGGATGRTLDVCWMLKSHLQQVVDIEEQCYGLSCGEADVVQRLREKDCIGLVALDQTGVKSGRRLLGEGKVLGYCIYRLCNGRPGVMEGTGKGLSQKDADMLDRMKRKDGTGKGWVQRGVDDGWIQIPGAGGDVADAGDVVAGGLARPVRSTRISDLGVREDARRQGVGTMMVSRVLRGVLGRPRDTSAVVDVPERFVDGQLFFRALGFRADGMVRCAVRGAGGDDGGFGQVVMRWHKPFDPGELFEVLCGGDLPR